MFSRMTKKSSLLSAISSAASKEKEKSQNPISTPVTPSATSATSVATIEKQQAQATSKEKAKRQLLSKLTMEASADAGNNNNTVDTDKTVVNSDGQALAKSGAVEKKTVSGTAPSAVGPAIPASVAQTNNNNVSVQAKNITTLKPPETPDEEGYTLGALNPNNPVREKSAIANRWGNRVSAGSPGSDESRPMSPSMDNQSDIYGGASRPKSRNDMQGVGLAYPNARYSVSNFWKARRVLFYRNGDPFFPAVEFRFKPGKDISSLDKLLDKISSRMDLPRGARYIFSMDGDRKTSLDELEDGSSYVVSSFKQFKVKEFSFFIPLTTHYSHSPTSTSPVSLSCIVQTLE